MVIAATWAGYPGAVCITPLAWLLALPVGSRIESHSTNLQPRQRLRQSTLAGGLLGLLQGLLFIFTMPRLGVIQDNELASAAGIAIFFLLAGIPIAAGLSTFAAWLVQHKSTLPDG